MHASELNAIILNPAIREIIIEDDVHGEVYVQRSNLSLTIRGVVFGSISVVGKKDAVNRKIHWDGGMETNIGTNVSRQVRRWLTDEPGADASALENVHIKATIDGQGKVATGFWAKWGVRCGYSINVQNTLSHGAMMVECLECVGTFHVDNVGVPNKTGQGYGVEVSSCVRSKIIAETKGVRYGVSFAAGGACNSVMASGEASVALIDIHGGGEMFLAVNKCEGVFKPFNESWTVPAVGTIVTNTTSIFSQSEVG